MGSLPAVSMTMAYRRRSVDWSPGEVIVLVAATALFFFTLVPAVSDTRALIGVAFGFGNGPFEIRAPSPPMLVFLLSGVTAIWFILRVERRAAERRRRAIVVIAAQIRESREEAERRRLLDEREESERAREWRLAIVTFTLLATVVATVGAFLLIG
jgi:hypothetical protein